MNPTWNQEVIDEPLKGLDLQREKEGTDKQ